MPSSSQNVFLSRSKYKLHSFTLTFSTRLPFHHQTSWGRWKKGRSCIQRSGYILVLVIILWRYFCAISHVMKRAKFWKFGRLLFHYEQLRMHLALLEGLLIFNWLHRKVFPPTALKTAPVLFIRPSAHENQNRSWSWRRVFSHSNFLTSRFSSCPAKPVAVICWKSSGLGVPEGANSGQSAEINAENPKNCRTKYQMTVRRLHALCFELKEA